MTDTDTTPEVVDMTPARRLVRTETSTAADGKGSAAVALDMFDGTCTRVSVNGEEIELPSRINLQSLADGRTMIDCESADERTSTYVASDLLIEHYTAA